MIYINIISECYLFVVCKY